MSPPAWTASVLGRARSPMAWFQLVAGLWLFAAGVVLGLRSRLGVGPWDVLHDGIRHVTPLSFGVATILVGVVLLVAGARVGPEGLPDAGDRGAHRAAGRRRPGDHRDQRAGHRRAARWRGRHRYHPVRLRDRSGRRGGLPVAAGRGALQKEGSEGPAVRDVLTTREVE